jgi:hypothetical protein
MHTVSETPAPQVAARKSRRWLAAALLFVLIRALPNISYPIGRDQATYCVIGRGLLHGQQLYRDLWDNKPPGIFAFYALLVKALGHVTWSVGLVDILWLLVLSFCIFRFTERYLGPGAAAIAVVVSSVWHMNLGYVDAAQPECFLMIAVFLSFFLASSGKRWPLFCQLAAGVLLGVAFWLKYNALAFFPLVAVVPYVDWTRLDSSPRRLRFLISWHRWLERSGLLLAGFAVTVVAVLAYFRCEGSWAALKEVQFQVLPRYAAIAVERIPHYWLLPIATIFLRLGVWTIIATVASVLIAEKRGFSAFLPVLAATAMGYAVTASQIRFPPYAFETSFPFFAMIWGYLATSVYVGLRAAARAPSRRSRVGARVAAGGLAAALLWFPVRGEAQVLWQRYRELAAWRQNPKGFYANYPGMQFNIEHLQGEFAVIEGLQKSLKPGEGVFVWGTAPLIYFLTDRQPPTRFVSNLALISPWGPAAWRQELVHDLRTHPPAYIVVAQDDQVPEIAFTPLDSEHFLGVYNDLGAFISTHYRRIAEYPQFVLFQLNSQSNFQ